MSKERLFSWLQHIQTDITLLLIRMSFRLNWAYSNRCPLQFCQFSEDFSLLNVLRGLDRFMIALRAILLITTWWLYRFFFFFNGANSFRVARNVSSNSSKFWSSLIFLLKHFLTLFYLSQFVIRPAVYNFFWPLQNVEYFTCRAVYKSSFDDQKCQSRQ